MAQYATAAQLAEHLGVAVRAGSQENLYDRALQAASRQIDGLCGRTFDATESAVLLTPLSSTIVKIGPARAISELAIDTDGDGIYDTVIPSEHYYIVGTTSQYITLNALATASFPLSTYSVRLTAIQGETVPPPEVVLATLLQAARLYKRKDAVLGDIQGDNGPMRIQGNFDQDAKQLLQNCGWLRSRGMVMA